MRALGINCGCGGMLIGARQAGFEVVGCTEDRPLFHRKDEQGRNTFETNFNAPLFKDLIEVPPELLDRWKGVDLVMGHPSCAKYSPLRFIKRKKGKKGGEIPTFVRGVKLIKPKTFVMDNNPRSLLDYPVSYYAEELPEYDLFFEYVHHCGYGNVQENRRRLMVIGALRELRLIFVPMETVNETTIHDVIKDLVLGAYPNHQPLDLNSPARRFRGVVKKITEIVTWAEAIPEMKRMPLRKTLKYINRQGVLKSRIGLNKVDIYGRALNLATSSERIHSEECRPFTLREYLRVQGAPDDFVIYGQRLNAQGEWSPYKDEEIVKQVIKFVPVQFSKFVAEQMKQLLKGYHADPTKASRLEPQNPLVTAAKIDYCRLKKRREKDICKACWLSMNSQPFCGLIINK